MQGSARRRPGLRVVPASRFFAGARASRPNSVPRTVFREGVSARLKSDLEPGGMKPRVAMAMVAPRRSPPPAEVN
ncbi:Hypothetical Protein RradSPS_3113 (plasmid) [Rubrobacter radiotolerans]|uniref:Uncharacterized protein n=1 Tax=Rubrobacter radiotolerans TaxID=42256 RepID=A0A023X853_RUBRA|nr:Hypothetical Protein RradSPS_3113 [Rubrobacter radiotolerans]